MLPKGKKCPDVDRCQAGLHNFLFVDLFERKRERVCVYVSVGWWCLCVCVCERERERETERVI